MKKWVFILKDGSSLEGYLPDDYMREFEIKYPEIEYVYTRN